MLVVGMALFALGLIGLLFGILGKLKSKRLLGAPLAQTGAIASQGRAVAGSKGQISAQGMVVCQQPLYAPFSGQACLYYSITCTARWKTGNQHKSKVIDHQSDAARFAIDDGSGPVYIDASRGADFDPVMRKKETKGTGLIGGVTGTDLEFGKYRVTTPMLDVGTTYEVEEQFLPIVPRLFACGAVGASGGSGNVIAPPSWHQLILSDKTRDALVARSQKTARLSLALGAAGLVLGTPLAYLGQRAYAAEAAATRAAALAAASTPAPSAAPAPVPKDPPMSLDAGSTDAAAPTTAAASAKPKGKGKGKGKGAKKKPPAPPPEE